MISINDIFAVTDSLIATDQSVDYSGKVRTLANNLNQFKALLNANDQQQIAQRNRFITEINNSLELLIKQMPSFDGLSLTGDQKLLLQNFETFNVWGVAARVRLVHLKRYAEKQTIAIIEEVESYISDYNRFKTLLNQLPNGLRQLGFIPEYKAIKEGQSIIEIVFDKKTDLNNFDDARHQMEDWYFIIHGYALLLGVSSEDFEIINISKNSPVSVAIRTAAKNAEKILQITLAIILIQKATIEKDFVLEKLKQSSLVHDSDLHSQYIKQAEEVSKKELNEKVNKLVDERLAEEGIRVQDAKGDVKKALKHSVEIQYKFINNGGDMRIQIGNNNNQPEIVSFEKTKSELKQIKDSLEEIKKLDVGKTGEEENQ